MSEARLEPSTHGRSDACHPIRDNDCDQERFVPVKADDPRLLGEGPWMSSNQKGARSSLVSAFMETNMVVGLNAKYALCGWVIGHALVHAAALPADQCQMQYGLPLSCCVRLGNGSAARQREPRCWLWNAGGVRARALPPVLLVPLLAMAKAMPRRPASCGAGTARQPAVHPRQRATSVATDGRATRHIMVQVLVGIV